MTFRQSGYCEIDFPDLATDGRLNAIFSQPLYTFSTSKIDEVSALISKVEAYALSGYWVIGCVNYEAAAAFDSAYQTINLAASNQPLAQFLVFQNITTQPKIRNPHLVGIWNDETPKAVFEDTVVKVKHDIAEGNYYQVNYTTRLKATFLGDGLSFFDELKLNQPSAYCAFIDFGNWQICSVSPELFFHYSGNIDNSRSLTCRPMKGTARRQNDPTNDQLAAMTLQSSEKERAENLMIVDLLRSDMSQLAMPGTVEVPQLFTVEAWPTVWQMTSTIQCRTRKEVGLLQIFKSLFPCGSVTGAPKIAAMLKINEIEKTPRGTYCGAIGVIKPGGEAIFSVGIRTPVIDSPNNRVTCGIGSGLTVGSDAKNEYEEWNAKQAFLRRSCPEYKLLETIRLHQGRYWLLTTHLNRIEKSAKELGFPYNKEQIVRMLFTNAKFYAQGQWRVRLSLSGQGEISVEALPLEPNPSSIRIAIATAAVSSSNPWLRHKTTHRELYNSFSSNQDGVFDTLLFNERDEITEFTRGNIMIEKQGRILTPAHNCGLLPGVLREIMIKRKRVDEAIITIGDLKQAKTVWFANSVRGLIPVKPDPILL